MPERDTVGGDEEARIAGASTLFLASTPPPTRGEAVGAEPAATELVRVVATSTHSRLRVLASIGIGAFGLGTLLSLSLPPLLGKPPTTSAGFALLCGGLTLLSVVMRLLARDIRRAPRRIVGYGLAYVVIAAWAMAATEVALRPPGNELRAAGVSGICIWIVLFPMLVPCRPMHALYTALGCAGGLPVAYLIGIAAGQSALPTRDLVDWFAPPLFCAGLAFAAAASIHRLTRALAAAREEVRALGSYRLEERLGSGGMGEVWRGRHRLLPRAAAIKYIRLADARDADPERDRDLTRRFEREARAIAMLESPHTIKLYDFGIDQEARFYYAMELLDGVDLETLVARHGAQSPARVVHILRAVCRSLSEAHDKGLVHRDIKPGNVMLCRVADERDVVKVLDFGLVSATQEHFAAEVGGTGHSGIAGTPGYIAPELLFGGGQADAASDLYAVGALGYLLLAGSTPFPTPDGGEDLVAHSVDRPPDPAERRGAPVPAALSAIVLACLAKKPADRPASAAELRRRLETVDVPAWTQDDAAAWWADAPTDRIEGH